MPRTVIELEQIEAAMRSELQNIPDTNPQKASMKENFQQIKSELAAAREAAKTASAQTADSPSAKTGKEKEGKGKGGVNYGSASGPKMSNKAARHVASLEGKAEAYKHDAESARGRANRHINKESKSILPGRVGHVSRRMQSRHHANQAGKERAEALRLEQKANTRLARAERVKHRQELKYQAIADLKKLPGKAVAGFKKELIEEGKDIAYGAKLAKDGMQNAVAAFKQWRENNAKGEPQTGGQEGFELRNVNKPDGPTRETGSGGSGDKNSLPKTNAAKQSGRKIS